MKRLLAITLLLAACRSEVAATPAPVEMTRDTLSHYCLMQVTEHPGPKAQIHLRGLPDPIFFAQVRDALAYVKGSERTAPIAAFYVSDMGVAPSWEHPGANNWITADSAFFIVGADVRGGMGAPEIVPFATRQAALTFARLKGGEVLPLDAIPAQAVLSPVEIALPLPSEEDLL